MAERKARATPLRPRASRFQNFERQPPFVAENPWDHLPYTCLPLIPARTTNATMSSNSTARKLQPRPVSEEGARLFRNSGGASVNRLSSDTKVLVVARGADSSVEMKRVFSTNEKEPIAQEKISMKKPAARSSFFRRGSRGSTQKVQSAVVMIEDDVGPPHEPYTVRISCDASENDGGSSTMNKTVDSEESPICVTAPVVCEQDTTQYEDAAWNLPLRSAFSWVSTGLELKFDTIPEEDPVEYSSQWSVPLMKVFSWTSTGLDEKEEAKTVEEAVTAKEIDRELTGHPNVSKSTDTQEHLVGKEESKVAVEVYPIPSTPPAWVNDASVTHRVSTGRGSSELDTAFSSEVGLAKSSQRSVTSVASQMTTAKVSALKSIQPNRVVSSGLTTTPPETKTATTSESVSNSTPNSSVRKGLAAPTTNTKTLKPGKVSKGSMRSSKASYAPRIKREQDNSVTAKEKPRKGLVWSTRSPRSSGARVGGGHSNQVSSVKTTTSSNFSPAAEIHVAGPSLTPKDITTAAVPKREAFKTVDTAPTDFSEGRFIEVVHSEIAGKMYQAVETTDEVNTCPLPDFSCFDPVGPDNREVGGAKEESPSVAPPEPQTPANDKRKDVNGERTLPGPLSVSSATSSASKDPVSVAPSVAATVFDGFVSHVSSSFVGVAGYHAMAMNDDLEDGDEDDSVSRILAANRWSNVVEQELLGTENAISRALRRSKEAKIQEEKRRQAQMRVDAASLAASPEKVWSPPEAPGQAYAQSTTELEVEFLAQDLSTSSSRRSLFFRRATASTVRTQSRREEKLAKTRSRKKEMTKSASLKKESNRASPAKRVVSTRRSIEAPTEVAVRHVPKKDETLLDSGIVTRSGSARSDSTEKFLQGCCAPVVVPREASFESSVTSSESSSDESSMSEPDIEHIVLSNNPGDNPSISTDLTDSVGNSAESHNSQSISTSSVERMDTNNNVPKKMESLPVVPEEVDDDEDNDSALVSLTDPRSDLKALAEELTAGNLTETLSREWRRLARDFKGMGVEATKFSWS